MKLVIDIPNGLYNAITNDKYGVHKGKLYDIIRNGTPLPKGHWIEREYNGIGYIECSECLSGFLSAHLLRNNYCPKCGAKMAESEE